jgi:hypothetical protein
MTPTPQAFTAKEWKLICQHRTPYQLQRFLNELPYNHEKNGETLHTFRWVVRHRSAHCLEAALSAAVILEQHGYPTLLLDIESQDDLDHVLFLYRKKGKWGTVARSRDPGLHGRKPVFHTLRELVDSYAEPFIDFSGRIVGFGVCNLADLGAAVQAKRLEGGAFPHRDATSGLPHVQSAVWILAQALRELQETISASQAPLLSQPALLDAWLL